MIGVKYGSFDMQANGYRVTGTDVYSSPENKVQADSLAESDGALIVKQQFTSKTFTVEGWFRGDDIPETESMMDAFKTAMSIKNQVFDIDYAGGIRRYLATSQNVILAKRGNTSVGYSVQFLSPDGVGWDLTSTDLLAPTGNTLSTNSYAITSSGSYLSEPLITVTVNTVTGGTSKTIQISNGTTLRGMLINRTWANGDALEIDSLKKTVYVNNIQTAFTGQFPKWDPGVGTFGYIDDFTTRDVTIRASYTRRWL